MATDIAFVVGFLPLLGRRVPHGLKILLLSLAIADDIGAVLVIAVVYSADLSLAALAVRRGGVWGWSLLMRWLGRPADVLPTSSSAAGIWLAFLKSGVHPTVAGVVLGLLTPAPPVLRRLDADRRRQRPVQAARRPSRRGSAASQPRAGVAAGPAGARRCTRGSRSSSCRCSPWPTPASPSTWPASGGRWPSAVAAGLVLGKPLGIVLFSLAAVRRGWRGCPAG